MAVRIWKVLGVAVLLGAAQGATTRAATAQDEPAPAPPAAWVGARPPLRRLPDAAAKAPAKVQPTTQRAQQSDAPAQDELAPPTSEPAPLPQGAADEAQAEEPRQFQAAPQDAADDGVPMAVPARKIGPAEPASPEQAPRELPPAESVAEEASPLAPLPSADEPLPAAARVVTERYPNGKPKIERTVIADGGQEAVNDGPWTMLSPSGSKIAWGEYRQGQRQGHWTRIYGSAQELRLDLQQVRGFQPPFTSEAEFESDRLHGEWTIKDAAGRTVEVWPFENGQLHGMVVQYHANGQVRSEAPYEGGVPTGVAKRYDSEGRVIGSETFINGRKLTPFVKRHGNGKTESEGSYLAATTQVNAEGDWWNASIQPEVVTIHNRPVKEGWWTHYHANGQRKFTGEFRDGRPVGTHTWWFPNGQTQTQGGFIDGRQDGLWTWWRENGQKQQEGAFADGRPEKNWVRFDESGTPISTTAPEGGAPASPGASQPGTKQRFPRQPAQPARPQAARQRVYGPQSRTAVAPPARRDGWSSAQATDQPEQSLQPTDDAALLPVPMEEKDAP